MKRKFGFVVLILISIVISFVFITKNRNLHRGITSQELWEAQYLKKKEKKRRAVNKLDQPDKFTEYFKNITTGIGENESGYSMNYKLRELKKAKSSGIQFKSTTEVLPWIQRGPANIGGRTRAVIIDPDDPSHNTWFAGSASGGIWKTTDEANTWTDLSEEITNLSVNALVMAASNHNVLYAGTGESFPGGTSMAGNGIWKSTDKGQSWTQLTSTATKKDFSFVNRIVVNSENENIVIAATESGIFKSIDGGNSWGKVYSSEFGVEDLVQDPVNNDTIYGGEYNVGIVRSFNGGDTWELSSKALVKGSRYEIDVSPVNHNNVFVSVNAGINSFVYISEDNGDNWKKFYGTNIWENILWTPENYLIQGDYDNVVTAHPFNEKQVYVGGVNIWMIDFQDEFKEYGLIDASTENTTFLDFINFGGGYLNGGMDTAVGYNIDISDWVSVEVRFGSGISQKAHLFEVPAYATSGVAQELYTFSGYVEVPFEVWDVTNNRQLMVSFRDQERNGVFDLYERTGDEYGELGREYIFINGVEYDSDSPDSNITKSGGSYYKALYQLWPILKTGEKWNPEDLPESKIVVEWDSVGLYNGSITVVSDAYKQYRGLNNFSQADYLGSTKVEGLHPDHHVFEIIPTGNETFTVVNGNDGGFAISKDNAVNFEQLPNNYITTQFYGVAKNPQENQYFGGMQDNGSWQSPRGEDANANTYYNFRLPGDGFEALWHKTNPRKLIGSTVNNYTYYSPDGGITWYASEGIEYGDGPFITRLSASKQNPDMIFAVGKTGVYKSETFGIDWKLNPINQNWNPFNEEYIYSSFNVEVSLADDNIVWAGGAMAESAGYQIQISKDKGESFVAVDDYDLIDMNSYVSGIATHPLDPATAYVLFSNQGKPKILRTSNYGETFEDISGFGNDSISANGFPDVIAHSLLIMPHNPNIIWAGTDIGLFESTDNGITWHIADNGLVPVSIYDMQIVGDQVVLATHGRGIWTVDIPELNNVPYLNKFEFSGETDAIMDFELQTSFDSIEIYIDNQMISSLNYPSAGNDELITTISDNNEHTCYILGYINGQIYSSNKLTIKAKEPSKIEDIENIYKTISIYPNPAQDYIIFNLDEEQGMGYHFDIYDLNGRLKISKTDQNIGLNKVDITSLTNGLYIAHIEVNGKSYNHKIQVLK